MVSVGISVGRGVSTGGCVGVGTTGVGVAGTAVGGSVTIGVPVISAVGYAVSGATEGVISGAVEESGAGSGDGVSAKEDGPIIKKNINKTDSAENSLYFTIFLLYIFFLFGMQSISNVLFPDNFRPFINLFTFISSP